jgi:small-conductance mechanosensitive channel
MTVLGDTEQKESEVDPSVLLSQAKNNQEMFQRFQQAILGGNFKGNSARSVSDGLAFLENVLNQVDGQIAFLKSAIQKKATEEKKGKD